MDYHERLNAEAELSDLRDTDSMQYIELKIKDQSVYWGEDLLLKEAELQHMQGTACQLSTYLVSVEKSTSKPKLAAMTSQQMESKLISRNSSMQTILTNTTTNAAIQSADNAAQRIVDNRKRQGKKKKE